MKEYFVVNNQEDEDGCVYSAKGIGDEAKKIDMQANSHDSKTNKKVASAKTYYHEEIPFLVQAKRSNER